MSKFVKVLGSNSSGNCYILKVGNESLLLECGVAWKEILKGLDFNIKGVRGCLLTHHHKDHSKAAKDLIRNGIKVYSTEKELLNLNIGCSNNLRFLKPKDTAKLGGFYVTALEGHHNNSDGSECECLSYLIYHNLVGNILFITDSFMTKYSFKNSAIDYLMVEANYTEKILYDVEERAARLLKSHMSIETCEKFMDYVNKDRLKEIMLIHLSSENANEDEFKGRIEKKTGCKVSIAKKDYEMRLK